MIAIIRGTHTHDDFRQLVRLLDADLNSRYGTLQAEYDQYNAIEGLDTIVLAYIDQLPVGCGGLKPYDNETAEIKRMYVKPTYRGKGIAGHILRELEMWATELGFSRAILETGKKQGEAIGFYQKNGYRQRENYGQYIAQPNSVCFEKALSPS